MQVNQAKTTPVFLPVTITFETEKEFETFRNFLSNIDVEDMEGNDCQMAICLLEDLNKYC